MGTKADHAEWRYLPGRGVKHAHSSGHPIRDQARCGTSPSWFSPDGWLGTGNQEEYETAARLPRCKRCVTLLQND